MTRVSVTGNSASLYASVRFSPELCAIINRSLYRGLVHFGMVTMMVSPMQGSVLGGGARVHICVRGSVVPVVMTVGPSGNAFALQDISFVY
jgi:hypothetical protein